MVRSSSAAAATANPPLSSSSSSSYSTLLLDLPDVLLFRVVSFAAAPTERATVVCHQLARLCRAAHQNLFSADRAMLWSTLLHEDYGVVVDDDDADDDMPHHPLRPTRKRRRKCQRLSRSPVERVRDAHQLMTTNTEIAFFYLSELANGNSGGSKKLTRARWTQIWNEYGPRLRIHRPVSNGGLFLVEVCRARAVSERTVLLCVQSLVEEPNHSKNNSSSNSWIINLRTNESPRCRETALCVAATRGMCSVVQYLLQHGADPDIPSWGRFSLHTNKKQSVRCDEATVDEFVRAMLEAEEKAGATKGALMALQKCLRMVERHQSSNLSLPQTR